MTTDEVTRIFSADAHGMARCPAHDDQKASLHISAGRKGGTVVFCHAGCEVADVLRAKNLTTADLFATPQLSKNGAPKRIVATYNYRDEGGALLFQAVRYEPKKFSQRRPAGEKGWIDNLEGVRRVLYRLPELLAADPTATVFIVEGEKHADRLSDGGLIATTNPMGAGKGKWRREYSEFLRDRPVVIMPDNDDTGRKHADAVARSIHGVAASIRMLGLDGLPEKGDVLNWLDAGGTIDALQRLAKDAPIWTPESTLTALTEQSTATTDEGKERTVKKSKAALVVDLASEAKLFHDAEGRTFASVEVNGHSETWPLKSSAFKRWLGAKFWDKYEATIYPPAIAEALLTLEGRATYEGETHEVHIRIAGHGGNIYVDLCDPDWHVVEITPAGWNIITLKDCPVQFRRTPGMLPLPIPEKGGDLKELRAILNLADLTQWTLVIAWLIAAFRPGFPYPVLAVYGEQGSAKTTTCRWIRALIDPNKAPLRSMPKDERDLVIAAANSYVVALDNVSRIPEANSDALCRLSTGGGFATRELYSNDDEIIFELKRPIILNGITEIATRSDLLDRAILVHLPSIPEEKRREEAAVRAEFDEAKARIFGAILSAVACTLKQLPKTKLDRLPRMADFARWATAAEVGMGLPAGAFMEAYQGNRAEANELALDASPLALELCEVFKDLDYFEGRPAELLKLLNGRLEARNEQPKTKHGWPQSSKGFTDKLKIFAPNLRAAGLTVEYQRVRTGSLVKIGKIPATSATCATSADPKGLPTQTLSATNEGRSATPLPDLQRVGPSQARAVAHVAEQNPLFTTEQREVYEI